MSTRLTVDDHKEYMHAATGCSCPLELLMHTERYTQRATHRELSVVRQHCLVRAQTFGGFPNAISIVQFLKNTF